MRSTRDRIRSRNCKRQFYIYDLRRSFVEAVVHAGSSVLTMRGP